MRTTVLLLLVTGFLVAPRANAQPAGCPNQFEFDVARLVNEERLAAGLAPLQIDVRLMAAAQRHSDDMAAQSFFSHVGSDGSTFDVRVQQAGYLQWLLLGENIAAGQTTPEAVMAAWMNSPGHRANILDPDFDHIGVGFATSNTYYRFFWTQEFGSTSSALQSPVEFCGPECSDGIDNDGDLLVDFPQDLQCSAPGAALENPPLTRCGLGAELAVALPPLLWLRGRRRRRQALSAR